MYGLAASSLGALLLFAAAHITPAETITLSQVSPTTTSPNGIYRWLDAADQQFSAAFRNSFQYSQASVTVEFETPSPTFRGTLTAVGLKPNFAYQVKLLGTPGTDSNERIGLAGRWWQQMWLGASWSAGWNLNNKGDGTSPNPNDLTYFETRDMTAAGSPNGKLYLYTGYLLLGYFITDAAGNATVPFAADSSYHVLWSTTQLTRSAADGPLVSASFDPAPGQIGYDADYPPRTVSIFGEWERLPAGGVFPKPGDYACSLILTEESFHGGLAYSGGWAAAMGGSLQFRILATPPGDCNRDCYVNILDMLFVRNHLGQDPTSNANAKLADVNADGRVNILDLLAVRQHLTETCR